MGWLDNLFGGGGQAPKDAANEYLNQIPGVAHQGYDDYINAGKDAGNKTKTAYEEMMNDPTGFINKLMGGYKESEGYKYQKDKLTQELGNTAAAGGIAGTPLDQMNQGEGVQKLLSADMQQFLTNVLGQHKEGLAGEEGIAERGYGASGKLTDTLGGALNQQGGLAFQNQQQNNQNKTDMWNMFGKVLGGAAGGFLGGVPGAAVGAGLFGGK